MPTTPSQLSTNFTHSSGALYQVPTVNTGTPLPITFDSRQKKTGPGKSREKKIKKSLRFQKMWFGRKRRATLLLFRPLVPLIGAVPPPAFPALGGSTKPRSQHLFRFTQSRQFSLQWPQFTGSVYTTGFGWPTFAEPDKATGHTFCALRAAKCFPALWGPVRTAHRRRGPTRQGVQHPRFTIYDPRFRGIRNPAMDP